METAAIHYLIHHKNWKPGEFRIEPQASSSDEGLAVVRAIFLEDESAPTPGGGESVELYVDRHEYRVIKALQFQ